MQREPYSHEQKVVNEEITKNRFLSVNTPIEQDTTGTLIKSSPWYLAKKSTLFNAHSEIKRRDAVSSVPLSNYNDLLEIRSIRQYNKPANNDNIQASIITINVSGDRFQTHLSTLELYPDTLLGNENKRKPYWNSEKEEYFFDRHRACFEAILYYYQSHGRLRRPEFVPIDTFLEEISFFQLGSKALAQVHQTENIKEVRQRPMPRILWRRYLWFYLEYPQHSPLARAFFLISMFFTVLSCVSLAIESLPQYTNRWDNICKEKSNVSLNSTFVPRCPALFYSPFFIIQTICVLYFTIEFLLRLISTPSYVPFILSFFNWVDLSSIVPYYVVLSIELADKDIGYTSATLGIRILRILRFTRIFKIYLVFQSLKSLRVLSATIRESLIDFTVLITILTLLAFLFGAATYFAEQQANGVTFDSIPKAIYWGIITITGVGYGDMVPITATGRILTCLCALLGAATMGMLVSVLVDRYQRVYNQKMYIPEPDVSAADFDIINNHNNDTESVFSLKKSGLIRDLSAAIIQRVSSFQDMIKNDRHQSHKFQFVVSFNDINTDPNATDRMITIMKKKLTEAISTADVDVNLKLTDNNSKEIWTVSSFASSAISASNLTLSTDIDNKQQLKFVVF